MRTTFKKFSPTRGQVVSALIIATSAALAYAGTVTLPNTFTAGTQASASQVNANFTAVKTAVDDNFGRLPRVWAHTDNTTGGTTVTSAGTEVNSVSINVPVEGIVTISGNVFVNNNGVSNIFVLNPLVDGTAVLGLASASAFQAAAGGAGVGELFTLSYTITVPISAGAHTVSQVVGPLSSQSFFYNFNHLTVTYMPASQANVTPVITPLIAGSGNADRNADPAWSFGY